MAVRHDVVVLEPEALKSGVLLARILRPWNSFWVEQIGNISYVSVHYRNSAIAASIPVAR